MRPNIKLTCQVFAGLLVLELGWLLSYRLNRLGWPGDWRSLSNRAVIAMGILFLGMGIFWILHAIVKRLGK
jgi:hypothetical protein